MTLSENATVEFKQKYVPDIIKSIVAFANTNGGALYMGIADDGSIVGVDDIDDTMLKISNSIRDSIKPDITLFVDYQQELIQGKTIIKIIVQKGMSSPYYISGKGIRPEGVYVRQGASSVPATETAILRMIKDTDGEKYEEARSLNQNLTFNEAVKGFKKRKVPFGTSQQKTLKLMNSDGIYTNLGLLLSDQCVHTIKLAVFAGTSKIVFQDRREFNGSLLKQLDDVYEYVDRYNRTRSEFEGLHRIDNRDYPVEAVREALLNAFAHRDYSFSDSTLISIFEDRMEVVSIGGLVKGISFDDMMLGVSIVRNRNLANVLYRLTLIEAYGTGIPKIMHSYGDSTLKPKIEATDNAFKITLPNTNTVHDASSLPATVTVTNTTTASPKPSLTANELTVLALFKEKEIIVRKDVEAILSVSQAMAVRILKSLANKSEIHAIGSGKNTRYTKNNI